MPAAVPPDAGDALRTLVEVLARRHALAALWELRGPAQAFRSLAQRLGVGEAALAQRLRELREAGIVEVDEAGDYRLTTHGRRLQGHLDALAGWAEQWQQLTPRQRMPRGAATRGRGEPKP